MSKIHFIGGEKGGVGKSVVARVVAQYLIDNNLPFLGFDTDRSHGSLLRFYSDFASPVVVDSYESLDSIIESATEQPDKRILVDLLNTGDTTRILHGAAEDTHEKRDRTWRAISSFSLS